MNELILISLLIIGVLVVIGFLLIIIVYKKKKEGKIEEPNYQVFFSIGLVWIPAGVVYMITINPALGVVFMVLGLSYIAIGLANRDKWKKKEE
ncbi:hypothetical protein AYK20_07905 [Thermoplasmatales archaeon SG8-52-1]|nr:MAG: hypothetical protein AYK20_07905 [Thermoplasmatales archaeon SG8-52-1]